MIVFDLRNIFNLSPGFEILVDFHPWKYSPHTRGVLESLIQIIPVSHWLAILFAFSKSCVQILVPKPNSVELEDLIASSSESII